MIDYDQLQLNVGEEMYNAPMFIRNFHIWKLAHLASRIIPITEKFQLPWNSVLHVLDNIQYANDELQDAPRVESNPFIMHEKYRKWIYHCTNFSFSTDKLQLPIDIDYASGMLSDSPTERRYIFKVAKLQQNLMHFKVKYKSNFKYIHNLNMLPSMKESLVIINHNPLFRVFVFGKLRFFRRFQLILASILNTACQLPVSRLQYIHVPLTTTVFTRDSFRKTIHNLSLTTLKYPNNYHYLMMMQFLNFVSPLADTSMLDRIPENYLKRIVFVFTVGNNALFYPLYDLKVLNENNRAYLRIVNQFNMLAMSHTEEIQKIVDKIPDEESTDNTQETPQGDTSTQSSVIKEVLSAIKSKPVPKIVHALKDTDSINNDALDNALHTVPNISEEEDTLKKAKQIDASQFDDLDEDFDPLSLETPEEYNNSPDVPDQNMQDDSGAISDDEVAQTTEDLIDVLVKHDKEYIKNKKQRQMAVGVIQARQLTDKSQLAPNTEIDTSDISNAIIEDINKVSINSPTVKYSNESIEDGQKRASRYLEEMDREAEILIDNLEDLTPKQKERFKKLATAYKNIPIGGKTVGEWLEGSPNISLKDIELDFLKNDIPDQSMLKSSTLSLDDAYMQNTFGRDLLAVATSFTKNGVFLLDIKAEPITTELNKLVKYTFKYEDVNGKSSSIHITLPQVNKHGHMFINGVKKIMKKQMVNLPIVKVSNIRVSLASALNKTIVERNVAKAYSYSAHISNIFTKLKALEHISVNYISSFIVINKPLAYEYTTLAKLYREVIVTNKARKMVFYFDYDNRLEYFSNNSKTILERITAFEKKHKAVVFCKDGSSLCFIDINNTVYYMDTLSIAKKTNIVEMLYDISDNKLSIKAIAEWTTLKLKDKNLPIIFVLAYQYGLINSLNYIKCHWIRIGKTDRRVIQDNYYDPNKGKDTVPIAGMKVANAYTPLNPGDKYIVKHSDLLIPFKNEYIVINRYPLIQSLIASGLLAFDTGLFNFEDMESASTYFTLLENKGYSTNYLKAITGFFGYFIDPMTRDKLELMGEPTNVRDLLIRSTQLLATEDCRQPASMANHCIRSYERFNVILFNEMARALETYQISGGAGSKFTINPESVFQRIITDQAIANIDSINPTMDLKERTLATYTGVGGRTAQSFVMEDRQFPDDGTGVLSEASVDSGKVGLVCQIATDASMFNSRGMLEHVEPDKLSPTQVLSAPALLMPSVTNDDGKRLAFCNFQTSHHLGSKNSDVCRVRTGFERVMAHRTTDSFASIAKFDGIVEEVNDQLKMIRVKYDNGDIDVFSYADQYTGSSGLVIEQTMQTTVKVGQKVKRGDVLVYNKEFFKSDPYSTQVDWKHGVMANVVLAERSTTLEDANGISTRLGEKFNISPVEIVRVVLHNDSIIHDILPVNKQVLKGEVLLTYEDGDLGETLNINTDDQETLAMIQQMSRNTVKTPISGTIVKIDAFYGCPIGEMHPSLAKIVRAITNYKNARNKYSAGTDAEYDNPISNPLPKGERYRGVDMENNIVVLSFYVKHVVNAGVGDKLVYDSSLKSVVSSTFDEPMLTESGVEVDAVFSGTGILHRVITSPLVVGSLQRVLEKTEKNIIEWWNSKKV